MRRSLLVVKMTNTNCCGGNCGCGADCNCGSRCGGCEDMNPALEWERAGTTSVVVAAQKGHSEGSVMVAGSARCSCNTCKCGTNCSCACCNCN